MTQEEILEGNKLIAKFMGYTYISFDPTKPKGSPVGWWKGNRVGIINKIENNYLGRGHHDLKYNSSWDWLTPVVEKVSKIPEYGYSFKRDLDGGLFIGIKNVWITVIEFIKWYNQNEK